MRNLLVLELRAAAVGNGESRVMEILDVIPCPGEIHIKAKCKVKEGEHFNGIRISDQYGFLDHIFEIELGYVTEDGTLEGEIHMHEINPPTKPDFAWK